VLIAPIKGEERNILVVNCPGIGTRELDFLARLGKVNVIEPKDCDKTTISRELNNTLFLILGGIQPIIDDSMIKCTPVEYIGVHATGYNVVPTYALQNGITVTNVPHYATEAVTELIAGYLEWFGLIQTKPKKGFQRARHIQDGFNAIRDGNFSFGGTQGTEIGDQTEIDQNNLDGKIFGILGLGAIGTDTAQFASQLGCQVIYNSRTRHQDTEADLGITYASLDRLFEDSDIVSISIPETDTTRGLIDDALIHKLKRGALLINTARQGVISESGYDAIASRVAEGTLRYADDVSFSHLIDIGTDIRSPHLVLTPHVGFNTVQAAQRKADIFCSNINRYLEGKQGQEINQVGGENHDA